MPVTHVSINETNVKNSRNLKLYNRLIKIQKFAISIPDIVIKNNIMTINIFL